MQRRVGGHQGSFLFVSQVVDEVVADQSVRGDGVGSQLSVDPDYPHGAILLDGDLVVAPIIDDLGMSKPWST